MSSCCPPEPEEHCHSENGKIDYFFWIFGLLVVFGYCLNLFSAAHFELPLNWLKSYAHATKELVHSMWLGVVTGIIFVGLLTKVPRSYIESLLNGRSRFGGILRATFAGLFLDLCSHGILMVGVQLYKKGASLGQLMAFLIASPWNSISLTLILASMIGIFWTLTFVLLSAVIAIISGVLFDLFVERGILPGNVPKLRSQSEDFSFWKSAKFDLQQTKFDLPFFRSLFLDGFHDSKVILRWLFFGIVIAAAVRTFVPIDLFQAYFGASVLGLILTLLAATVIEVCSEGSAPLAADLLVRASAPGNSFAFLMTGISTDYTEIMVLKDTTKSWKVAFFLPLVTVPQIIILALLLNHFGT